MNATNVLTNVPMHEGLGWSSSTSPYQVKDVKTILCEEECGMRNKNYNEDIIFAASRTMPLTPCLVRHHVEYVEIVLWRHHWKYAIDVSIAIINFPIYVCTSYVVLEICERRLNRKNQKSNNRLSFSRHIGYLRFCPKCENRRTSSAHAVPTLHSGVQQPNFLNSGFFVAA